MIYENYYANVYVSLDQTISDCEVTASDYDRWSDEVSKALARRYRDLGEHLRGVKERHERMIDRIVSQ